MDRMRPLNDRVAPAVEQSKMKRNQLHDALCELQNPEINTLIFKLGVPTAILPGENAARADRVTKLLEWAKIRGRIPEVERFYCDILGINPDPQ
jgi:hypothetical protein